MTYSRQNDYTLIQSDKLPGGAGTLTRVFNFASGTVTTIFRETAEKEKSAEKYAGSTGGYAVSSAVAVGITSQMQVHKFSELDSLLELKLMREELVRLGGKPPELSDVVNSPMVLHKDLPVSKPLQIKSP